MAICPVEVVRVSEVLPHPDADRLEIVQVLGTQFVAPRGDYKVDDLVVYFPPDTLIPEPVAQSLGVANYLKKAVYPGDTEASKCRIGAIRLRGIPSYGFGVPITDAHEGDDLTATYYGKHWQPPEPKTPGDSCDAPVEFHEYTDIQNYYKYASVLPEGTLVRILEKCHGSQQRTARINGQIICGSHHRAKKELDSSGHRTLYWLPYTDEMSALIDSFDGNVIVFSEIYGQGVQFMDYGTEKTFRVFDISVNGQYLGWEELNSVCAQFNVPRMPLLYMGTFSGDLIDKYVDGPTRLAESKQIRCKFKGREGIVITPLKEQFNSIIGRVILKAVSADYHAAM